MKVRDHCGGCLNYGNCNIVASASPKLVPSSTFGIGWLPSPNSFQASISTRGGLGAGSGRNCGLAMAHAMASCVNVATPWGARLYQIKSPEVGSVSLHGRGSQPAIAVGISGS